MIEIVVGFRDAVFAALVAWTGAPDADMPTAAKDKEPRHKPAHAEKPIAAICHGPWLLAEADVVRDRTVTSWPSIRTDLSNAGANVVDEEVATDGFLITSRKPDDIPAFTEALIEAIEQR